MLPRANSTPPSQRLSWSPGHTHEPLELRDNQVSLSTSPLHSNLPPAFSKPPGTHTSAITQFARQPRRGLSTLRKTFAPRPQLSLRWICSKALAMEHFIRGSPQSWLEPCPCRQQRAVDCSGRQEITMQIKLSNTRKRLNFPRCPAVRSCHPPLHASTQSSRSAI
jgi:hypothetical protein